MARHDSLRVRQRRVAFARGGVAPTDAQFIQCWGVLW